MGEVEEERGWVGSKGREGKWVRWLPGVAIATLEGFGAAHQILGAMSWLEDGFALEDEVLLFVRGSVPAPLEGHDDAHDIGVEDGDSKGGRSDATRFEEA